MRVGGCGGLRTRSVWLIEGERLLEKNLGMRCEEKKKTERSTYFEKGKDFGLIV